MERGDRSGRLDELRDQHRRRFPPSRRLHWSNLERRQSGRNTSPAADQVRTGNQSQDGWRARPQGAAAAACASRRGDRVKRGLFLKYIVLFVGLVSAVLVINAS